ncbi:MAG: NAD(P)H-hydrate dehydratase [Gammaproteobacteria bacterium]|nr:NAD(P)H-hydrate dehydratase [Gammaproteobacteria bacterium]
MDATGFVYVPTNGIEPFERMRQPTRNVFTASEVRAFDRRAIDEFSIPGIRLMHRAGRAAFDVLRSRWPDARALSIICGSGNNAGDGYVVAGCAKDAGFDVQLLPVGDPRKLAGEAMQACRYAKARLGGRFEQQADGWDVGGDVIVDALLGTGAKGAVRLPYQTAIDRMNGAGKPILALDLPSGVDADTGGLLTAHPVRAGVTVTFVAAKLGLVTGDAVDFVGELVVDDLDLPEAVFDKPGVRVLDGAGLATLVRRPGAHKGDFGRLLIVGGESDMGGAVLLAGEAALRTGAGLVTIATRTENRAAILARRPELMVRGVEGPKDIADLVERASAIAVGPGLGRDDWGAGLLKAVVGTGKPLVVDADGLNIVADRGIGLPSGTIVTPHPGEAGRLLGETTAWIQSNRPEAAARLSSKTLSGVTAVLKGAGTLIAAEGTVASVCLGGNPGMATAGSGDVLTGVVGALLARGMAPLAAAELGVWLHARAGDEARDGLAGSLIAGDLIGALRLTA